MHVMNVCFFYQKVVSSGARCCIFVIVRSCHTILHSEVIVHGVVQIKSV